MLSKRLKDVHRFLRSIDSFSNKQASIVDWDSDNLRWIKICLAPDGGPYSGGEYIFEVSLGKSYPTSPPEVTCLTPIYHPNIDAESENNVCVNILDEWQDSHSMEDLVQGLLFLIHNPNMEDPLSPWFSGADFDEEQFVPTVRKTLQGGMFFGVRFPKMINIETSDVIDKTVDSLVQNALESAMQPEISVEQGAESPANVSTIPTSHKYDDVDRGSSMETDPSNALEQGDSNLVTSSCGDGPHVTIDSLHAEQEEQNLPRISNEAACSISTDSSHIVHPDPKINCDAISENSNLNTNSNATTTTDSLDTIHGDSHIAVINAIDLVSDGAAFSSTDTTTTIRQEPAHISNAADLSTSTIQLEEKKDMGTSLTSAAEEDDDVFSTFDSQCQGATSVIRSHTNALRTIADSLSHQLRERADVGEIETTSDYVCAANICNDRATADVINTCSVTNTCDANTKRENGASADIKDLINDEKCDEGASSNLTNTSSHNGTADEVTSTPIVTATSDVAEGASIVLEQNQQRQNNSAVGGTSVELSDCEKLSQEVGRITQLVDDLLKKARAEEETKGIWHTQELLEEIHMLLANVMPIIEQHSAAILEQQQRYRQPRQILPVPELLQHVEAMLEHIEENGEIEETDSEFDDEDSFYETDYEEDLEFGDGAPADPEEAAKAFNRRLFSTLYGVVTTGTLLASIIVDFSALFHF